MFRLVEVLLCQLGEMKRDLVRDTCMDGKDL